MAGEDIEDDVGGVNAVGDRLGAVGTWKSKISRTGGLTDIFPGVRGFTSAPIGTVELRPPPDSTPA